MADNIFAISFEFDSRQFNGRVTPSGKLNDSGTPESFHVELNDVSFGQLSIKDCNWVVNEERPAALVQLVGMQIEKHFQL